MSTTDPIEAITRTDDPTDECPYGSERCEGPDGDVLPCFDCYMADLPWWCTE